MRYAKSNRLVKPKKKNSKKKKVIVSIIGILALCAVAVCILLPFLNTGKAVSLYDASYIYDGNDLLGVWREEHYDEYYFQTYNFEANGNVTLTSYYYGIKETSVTGKYAVSDKNLITIVYNESTDSEKTEQNRFSVTKDGSLVMKVLGQNGESELVMTRSGTKYNNDLSIFGKWSAVISGSTLTYTFNSDYTGSFEDSTGAKETFVYSTTEDNLYWIQTITYKDTPPIFASELFPYKYSIEGKNLILTVKSGEESLSYTLTKE